MQREEPMENSALELPPAPPPGAETPMARIREQRKMSQRELAAAMGLSQSQIARLESRERRLRPEYAKTAAEILQCHWLELMEESPRLTPKEEILLARFRKIPDADQDVWLDMMKEPEMPRLAVLLQGFSTVDRDTMDRFVRMATEMAAIFKR